MKRSLQTIVQRLAKRGGLKRSFNDHKKCIVEHDHSKWQMGSLKAKVQQTQKGFVKSNRSTVVKRDVCKRSLYYPKKDRCKRSFYDPQMGWLRTTAHQSCKEIVTNGRYTIGQWDRWTRSFNNRQRGWLETIVQWSPKATIERDLSTIDKRDRPNLSFNNRKKVRWKQLFNGGKGDHCNGSFYDSEKRQL